MLESIIIIDCADYTLDWLTLTLFVKMNDNIYIYIQNQSYLRVFFNRKRKKKNYNRKPEARSVRRASNKKATKHTFYLTTQHKTQTNSQEYNCLHSSNNCFTEYLLQNLINNKDN